MSDYYLWEGGRWQTLDAVGWSKDLEKKIARKDRWQNKDVWPDLKTMTAEVSLFRAGDPSCCGSGGTARVKLSLKNRRLQITAVTVTDAAPTSPESPAKFEDYREPPVSSPERKAILDAIRPLVERELKQPINFVVRALPVADDWAVALLVPITKEGKSIEWTKTSMASKEKARNLWMPWALALLKKEIGRWTVWEFSTGEIYEGLEQWPERYPNVPKTLFDRAGLATNCDPCE